MGHGLVGSRSSGGFGKSSIWVIEAAPCRRLVPMQSDPVSPPADDHHVLPRRGDLFPLGDRVSGVSPVLLREELHREVDPLEVPPGDGQVACRGRPGGQDDRVEGSAQVRRGDVHPRVDALLEDHPLGPHLVESPVDDPLLELEVGDAVPQEPPDPVRLLEDHHLVAVARELLGGGQPRGARPHDGHALAGRKPRRLRPDPLLAPAVLHDLELEVADGDRGEVDRQGARGLARGGTDPARDLRKVAGGVQQVERLPPVLPVDHVVPVGDPVLHGAAVGVAERDPAIHAAHRLAVDPLLGEQLLDLAVVPDPLRHRPVGRFLPIVFHEPGRLSHGRPPRWRRRSRCSSPPPCASAPATSCTRSA